jgi:tetratricopeptide (TPR) repeat protein
MNSITRLILQRLASGKVRLTWEVIEALKEVSPDKPGKKTPERAEREPAANPEESDSDKSETSSRLTFVNPLPGRWIRRTGCVAGGALLLAAGLFQASAGPATFDAANTAFAKGNFAEAARGFESVVAQQGYSAPALFNLANAQQRNGQPGPAILNYERAALLAPNDPDIAANLQAARQQACVEVKKPSAMHQAARRLTLNVWFGLAALAVFLIAVMLALKQLRPQLRGAGNFVIVLAAFVLVAAVGAIGLRGKDLRRAVVTVPEAVVGIAPVTVAQPVFKLRAGEIVTLKQAHGDFELIVNHAGHEGWVKAGNVERIIPLAHPAKDSRS